MKQDTKEKLIVWGCAAFIVAFFVLFQMVMSGCKPVRPTEQVDTWFYACDKPNKELDSCHDIVRVTWVQCEQLTEQWEGSRELQQVKPSVGCRRFK